MHSQLTTVAIIHPHIFAVPFDEWWLDQPRYQQPNTICGPPTLGHKQKYPLQMSLVMVAGWLWKNEITIMKSHTKKWCDLPINVCLSAAGWVVCVMCVCVC
jgi:hypothetical protein